MSVGDVEAGSRTPQATIPCVLGDLFERLDAFRSEIPLGVLREELTALPVPSAELARRARFSDEHYIRNLIHAAEAYLYERKLENASCRFDVVSIVLQPGQAPRIEHFEDAFWGR